MLEPKNYTPIDIETVKEERDKIYNVPNSEWESIQKDMEVINNKELPLTLRTYKLNHLPYCVIVILNTL